MWSEKVLCLSHLGPIWHPLGLNLATIRWDMGHYETCQSVNHNRKTNTAIIACLSMSSFFLKSSHVWRFIFHHWITSPRSVVIKAQAMSLLWHKSLLHEFNQSWVLMSLMYNINGLSKMTLIRSVWTLAKETLVNLPLLSNFCRLSFIKINIWTYMW